MDQAVDNPARKFLFPRILSEEQRDLLTKKVFSKCEPFGHCLVWTGRKINDGRGPIKFKSHLVLAHRAVAAIFFGFDLNSKNLICHHCDNPSCVKPNHLYIGTHHTNKVDRVSRGTDHNTRKRFCKNGHEFTPSNTYFYTYKGSKKRRCESCNREFARKYDLKNREKNRVRALKNYYKRKALQNENT